MSGDGIIVKLISEIAGIPGTGAVSNEAIKGLLGELSQKQINHRTERTIHRIGIRLSRIESSHRCIKDRLSTSISEEEAGAILHQTIDRCKRAHKDWKINVYVDAMMDSLEGRMPTDVAEHLQYIIESLPEIALQVLAKMGEMPSSQMHAESRPMDRIEEIYGYDVMIGALHQLASQGLIGLQVNHSSIYGKNGEKKARFIVFWRPLATTLHEYIVAANEEARGTM